MDKRLQNKNERAINKRNVDLIIAREEAKRKKRQMKERTGNPKIDGPLEDFERVYGYKFEPKFADDMKDGGLAMAIEKVKAKEMKDGGNVPKPKLRPKSLKADKTESLDKEFSKNVAKTNKMNMDNVKKKKDGGLIGGQKKLDKNKDGKISGADFAMMKDGGEAKNRTNAKKFKKNVAADRKSKMTKTLDKKNPVRALARIVDDEFESSNIHDYGGIHVGGKVYTDKDRGPNKRLYKPQKPSKVGPKKFDDKIGPIEKMRKGGKVEEYGGGGSVKGGKMSCRGMGAAIKGGGFSIR